MKKIDHRTLARYLSGSSTDKEKQAVKKWVLKDSSNKQLLQEYKTLWERAAMSIKREDKNFDAEQGWIMLKKQINKEKAHQYKNGSLYASYFKQSGDDAKFRLMRVAAIFLVAAFIGFFAYRSWEQPMVNQAPVLQEIVTDIGQRTHLTLADGTRILLNADSKLRLPKMFQTNKREVFLEGQAFFEVAENPNKPFLIHIDGTTVRVLGTSFSISAYPEDENVQVVVKEGRVSFEVDNSAKATHAVITANELAVYDETSKKITTRKVKDLSLYLGWLEGSLNFKEALMKDVAADLERRYGVQVTFNNKQIKKMELTAHLKSKRIRNVLDVIALSLNLNYDLTDNNVTFYKR